MKIRRDSGKRIAKERIARLFQLAPLFYETDPVISNRCVDLARKIAMRQRVRIDRAFKWRFCHSCHSFLIPGKNMRVRIREGKVVMTCLLCKERRRYPVVKSYKNK